MPESTQLDVDFFFSFRSPYSYLSVPRIRALALAHPELAIHVRIVLPLAVRTPEFFDRVNPLWPPYLVRDCVRLAEHHGIGFHWPRPDPVVQDYVNRVVPTDQPYIHRLSRLGVRAAELGEGLSFIHEVSRIIWSGEVVGWNEGDHLARAAERAGLSLPRLEADVAAEPEHFAQAIEDNQQALSAAGHWGVPTFVFQGEPFFGQDRIDLLIWRLRKHGLSGTTAEQPC
jgi:2-hydroxychromene-2-carboxylate isomerase